MQKGNGKYLTAEIYRGSYNSELNTYQNATNVFYPAVGGIYSREQVEERDRQNNEGIPVIFKSKQVYPGEAPYIYAEPDTPGNYQFGGTYIKSSDSRFRETTGISYPIPLHDRQE